jgi:hypothetical protein
MSSTKQLNLIVAEMQLPSRLMMGQHSETRDSTVGVYKRNGYNRSATANCITVFKKRLYITANRVGGSD